MTKPHQRLMELLDKILSESATDDDRQEFSRLVEDNPRMAREFIEQMDSHTLLQLQGRREHGLVQLATLLPKYPAQSSAKTAVSGKVRLSRLWAIAACTLVAGLGLVSYILWSTTPSYIAEVIDQKTATWSANTTALKSDGGISTGILELVSGDVILQFRSGAVVNATGPATMKIESDMLVFLEKGQASANVPKWAKGFTIATPDVKVVDLGTRFGVLARDDKSTDVVVFEGEVDLKTSSAGTPSQRRLYQGEGVRITNEGQIDRVVEVRRKSTGSSWSTDSNKSQAGLIRSIRDNITPASSVKYYEVVSKGLDEDTLAYVDRVHEWNGIDAEGLPGFLKGIDYVRTFNDFKYAQNLKIELELTKPATVYIFFDDRVPPPDWLKASFVDTGVNIGLDEGPWSYVDANLGVITDPNARVGIGAGASVEQTFSVWKRECLTPETLVLGPLGEHVGARAAYGIAVSEIN
jgi:ferric-dicitrate binding protein FerR (iron transport regulator)